jgi:hypothetical protein
MLDLTPLLRYLDGDVPELPENIEDEINEEEAGAEDEEKSIDEPRRSSPVNGRTKLQKQFHNMTASLCDVVNDYGLVSFLPLNIEDVATVARILAATDRANGFNYVESIKDFYEEQDKKNSRHAPQLQVLQQPGETNTESKRARKLFHFASEKLESLHEISLEIQEKYGKS